MEHATIERGEDGDVRSTDVVPLPSPDALVATIPVTPAVRELVRASRAAVSEILRDGADHRLLAIVGPCSIHDAGAALRYAEWLRAMRARYGRALLIVMRAYIEKPRTRHGWKGIAADPDLDGRCRIDEGLRLARRLLLAINELGVPTATELVNPMTSPYVADLVSWAAIGARTTESQVHRELASGLPCPVGFKNSRSGDVDAAIDAVLAARRPHRCLALAGCGRASIVSSTGNRDGHVVLRGGARGNYDDASVRQAADALAAEGLPPRVLIDCSHGNCGGHHRRQLDVAAEIVRQVEAGSRSIAGVMVESHLRGGTQRGAAVPAPLLPDQSITDPCLGLDDTEALLAGLARAASGDTPVRRRDERHVRLLTVGG